MAVRHGYGKVAGADALQFAYDTGDTVNSYKGKPATNIATTISTRGGDVIADPTDMPTLPKSIAPAVYCSSKIVESTNSWQSLFEYSPSFSLANGERLIITAWVYVPVGKTNNRFNINCTIGGNNTGMSQAPSHDIPTGRWVKLLGSYTNTTGGTVSCNGARLETYTAAEWTGNITCWAANFMIEKGSDIPSAYRGSPATALGATRSATQGLLDLTGTNTIDLSSVNGYNSNAQLEFDGTNDKIDINIDSWIRTVDNITVEGVVEIPSGASMGGGPWAILTDHSTNSERDGFWWHMRLGGGYTYFRVEDTVYGERGITFSNPSTFSAGNTYHIATVVGNDGVYVYNNGVQVETYSPPFNWADISSSHTASLTIGRTYPGYWLNALIHNLKLYNRALTAAEVKNNYNNYKGRFNI